MKHISPIITGSVFLVSLTFNASAQVEDTTLGSVRQTRDNVGFGWNSIQMKRLINYLRNIDKTPAPPSNIVAAISPHDDYLYAARVYYPLTEQAPL